MKKKIKRLGVFVFFDRDNIVDDYVLYMLDDMMNNLDDLVILSNSKLSKEEKNKFNKYTNKIIMRENKGLDAGAWCEYFRSTDEYSVYDEVVCFNDTFFGPLYPFKEMFDEMEKRDVDFWGLSQGHTHRDGYGVFEGGIIPNHIQTFLITFRNNVINSDVFKDYWNNYDLDNMLNFVDVVSKHELSFTKYLEDNGFKWDCYVKDTDGTEDFTRNYVNFAYNAYGQIVDCRAPFIKRKTIVSKLEDLLYFTDLGDIKKSIDFIKNNTDYDVNLIYKNILRLYNIDLLRESMGFYEIVQEVEHSKKNDVSIIIKLDNEFLMDRVKLLSNMLDNNKQLLIYTKSTVIYDYLKDFVNIKIYKNSWQSTFIKIISEIESEYIQYINLNDNKNAVTLISETTGIMALDNLFLSSNYYESVIDVLNDDNVSVVYTPECLHFDNLYNNLFWTKEIFEQLKELFPDYRYFDYSGGPITKVDCWLTKKEILNSIDFKKLKKTDDEEFSKILSIALVYAGIKFNSIPRIVMNKEIATVRLNTLSSIYKGTYSAIYKNNEYPLTYFECKAKLNSQRDERRLINVLKAFIKRKLHIRRFKFWKK